MLFDMLITNMKVIWYSCRTITTTFEDQGAARSAGGAEGPLYVANILGVVAGAGAGVAEGTGGSWSQAKPPPPLSDCVIKMLHSYRPQKAACKIK